MDFAEIGNNYEIYCGDSLVLMGEIPENTFDTCITDPPYHLKSITQRFGKKNSAPAQYGKDGAFSRVSKGFLGQEWDGGDISFDIETWRKVYRVMKPGGTLLCFGGTRTYHRIAVAIEDAGFILKDTIMWVYGQGFPKAYDVSKGIDKRVGAERPVVGRAENAEEIMRRARQRPTNNEGLKRACREDEEWVYNRANITAPATKEALLWNGWATALKPAYEPIIVAVKPVELSNVDNALKWGVDGFWIEGSRVNNRYPSNFIHDGSEEVLAELPKNAHSFFYCAKPTRAEKNKGVKNNNGHPTVKPLNLMKYLARLTKTPTDGVVFDPFMGSGTTGLGAILEGREFYGIEKEPEYYELAKQRLHHIENLPIREPVVLPFKPDIPIEIISAAVHKSLENITGAE